MKSGLLFDSLNYFFENVQLYLRIAKKYKVIFINEPLVKRRFLNNSLSHKNTKLDRYAQIKVYSLVLLDFPEYRNSILRKLMHSKYSVARLEFMDKEILKARKKLLGCIKNHPFLGRDYIREGDPITLRVKKIITPFVLLLIACLPKKITSFFIDQLLKERNNSNENW